MRVEEVVAALEARAGHGLGSFAPDERTVWIAWQGTRLVEQGGLGRFFGEGGDIEELERAYRRLGLMAAAAACTTARQLFPAEFAFGDRAAMEELLRARADELKWAFVSIGHPLLAATRAGLRGAMVAHLRMLGMDVE